jgi:hypothetical protein
MSLLGSKIRVITDYSSCGSYRKQRDIERQGETEKGDGVRGEEREGEGRWGEFT